MKRFERIPELIHGTDPAFTPPFPGSVVGLIGPKSVFLKTHGEITPLIAYRDGKPVGRIAAIVNRSHNAYSKDSVGFFGFFDFINDPGVARALLDAAAAILRERGLTVMRGPYNPSINDDCGVLTEGNERPTFVSMPWNPPYYAGVYKAAGLEVVRTLYAYDIPLHKEPPERVTKIVNWLKKRNNVSIRTIDMKNLRKELETIHRLYNQCLDRNWGFYPIALDDLLHTADDLRAIADPSIILFVCIDGREVGFTLALPNVNEVFHASRGRKGILRFLEMALRLKFQRIKTDRLTVLGVEPDYRDKGLSALLFFESFRIAKAKYKVSEVSWVEANNVEILEGAELMWGHRSRTYEIFEKPLA
jgi:GNAT superfamily N-acetyltransferase